VPTKKRAGKTGVTRPARKPAAQTDGKPAAQTDGKPHAAAEAKTSLAPERPAAVAERKTLRISTVSHTLDTDVAERLRYFAFHQRVSESAVIEFALRQFFEAADDASLGRRLRDSGAALRRKS
jgi:hypothetical protein